MGEETRAWGGVSDGGKEPPSTYYYRQVYGCFFDDVYGLENIEKCGVNNICFETDYPHTDTTWPTSPEFSWNELQGAGCRDDEIHKITWQNACRFFDWDPFKHTSQEQATVGALRGLAKDVDVTRMPRAEWRQRNEAAGIGVFT